MIGFSLRKIFYRKLTKALTEITLNKNGFSILEPFGAKPKFYFWSEIQSIKFSSNYENIIIDFSNKQKMIENRFIGYYEFMQNVPLTFTEFDFNYSKELINSLKSCKVCGIIAVSKNKCIVCETIPWNSKMNENEIEYIKSKQLEYYSEHIKNREEIKKIAEPEHGFKADKNWKLYI